MAGRKVAMAQISEEVDCFGNKCERLIFLCYTQKFISEKIFKIFISYTCGNVTEINAVIFSMSQYFAYCVMKIYIDSSSHWKTNCVNFTVYI